MVFVYDVQFQFNNLGVNPQIYFAEFFSLVQGKWFCCLGLNIFMNKITMSRFIC